MPHSYTCILFHVVFSTKERQPWISTTLHDPMRAYIGGIARQNGMTALAVGGTADHIHLLMTFAATMPLAKTVQLIKAGSSKWFRENHQPRFQWQEGYAAFTVSKSHQEKVAAYIHGQERHHRKRDFRDEMMELFRHYGIHPDDRWFN